MSPEPAVILVTGGTGLIGKAIEYTIQNEPEGSRFGKRPGETWIFAGVGEGDLKYVIFSCTYCIVLKRVFQRSGRHAEALRKVQTNSCHPFSRPRYGSLITFCIVTDCTLIPQSVVYSRT